MCITSASQAAPLEPRASGSAESRVLCYGLTAGGQDGQHQTRFGQVLLKIAAVLQNFSYLQRDARS